MKKSELKQFIIEEIEKVLKENISLLAKEASKLYTEVLNTKGTKYNRNPIDDEALDDAMEGIVKKVGLTPEQKKIKSAYKFALGDHPKFETLTDQQLSAVMTFLKEVKEKGTFESSDWDWELGTWSNNEEEYED
jgi:hypothetical protein